MSRRLLVRKKEMARSIWDHMTHENPCVIKDCSSGDVADDSYHQVERDVQIMRELGLDFYRFSISWPRLLPTSFPDKINPAGVGYYNRLIDEMLKYNVQPIVTLYHWDLPQRLQEMGGWSNPAIVDWFADYSRVVFMLFGDRVKYFNTINEPYQICYQGYGDVAKAPMLNIKGIAEYMCAKNLLLAHAKVYHMYDQEFRAEGGVIFITFSAMWYEPASDSEVDIMAANEASQFLWGLYVHPIYAANGDYPPPVKRRVAAKSAAQGFPRTRLQELTQQEIEYIRGTSDLFGLNHYSTNLVYRNESAVGFYDTPSFYDDFKAILYQNSEWKIGESDFVKNGFATYAGLEDTDRIQNYKGYLSALLDAIDEGSDIRAYTAWSKMDNFEWLQGYVERFGLYEVDYESPEQMLRTRALDFNYEPDNTNMTIDEGH